MKVEKKLILLEEMLELDEGALRPEMALEEIEEWDSVSVLSFIVLLDEEFGKAVSGKELKELKTLQDVLDMMES